MQMKGTLFRNHVVPQAMQASHLLTVVLDEF